MEPLRTSSVVSRHYSWLLSSSWRWQGEVDQRKMMRSTTNPLGKKKKGNKEMALSLPPINSDASKRESGLFER